MADHHCMGSGSEAGHSGRLLRAYTGQVRCPVPAPTRRDLLQQSLAIAGLGLLAGCAMRLPGSPQAKVHRIGFLAGLVSRPDYGWYDAFMDGLREHGYVEGHNVVIEYRSAEGIA